MPLITLVSHAEQKKNLFWDFRITISFNSEKKNDQLERYARQQIQWDNIIFSVVEHQTLWNELTAVSNSNPLRQNSGMRFACE